MTKTKKKATKPTLYIGKEVYGKMPKEEAFQKAFEPYFVEEKRELVS